MKLWLTYWRLRRERRQLIREGYPADQLHKLIPPWRKRSA